VDTNELSDEDLCRRVAQDDEGAFDLLVGRYQERAHRIVVGCAGSEEARTAPRRRSSGFTSRPGRLPDRPSSPWFYRILVNCCLDQARKRKGWRKLIGWGSQEDERGSASPVERVAAPFVDPTDAMVTDSRMSQLWEAVEELSPQQRAAVMLQCREELSTKEIAAVLHLSEATVRVHLHRAYSALKRKVGEAGTGEAR
jgi:RNA polymerase sigma-70 factor (ECF subfamily)